MSTFAEPPSERTPLAGSVPAAYSYDTSPGSDDGREVEVWRPGKSTFTDTLLNTLGDLIGTGLLAAPIAFAHSGWIVGTIALLAVCAVTLWTLKILLRIIALDRRLRNFTDVIGYALGPRGESIVSVLFVLEVCAWIIALVVIFSDSLEAVAPVLTSDQWKVAGLAVIIPTIFLPLNMLSWSSAIGITSTWMLVGILIFTGIVTPHSPGSIREPAHTDLWPSHGIVKLGTVFGLLISGFGGHGLIPNLIHDMKNPRQADRMCELAYLIAMVVYFAVAVFGYLMYGTNVSDEVSKDLARTPGFSPFLSKLAVWMVALNPLTKIALGVRPLADMIFTKFDLHKTILLPEDAPTPYYATRPASLASPTGSNASPPASEAGSVDSAWASGYQWHGVDVGASHISIAAETRHDRRERMKDFIRPAIRLLLAVMSVVGALLMPSFETVMSLLGSGFAVLTLIIIPVWAGATVFGWRWYHYVAIVLSAIIGTLGTIASFWPTGDTTA